MMTKRPSALGPLTQPARGPMSNHTPTPASDRVMETMIELARCSKFHRIIVAGSDGISRMSALHRRGYKRISTTSTCGLPHGQYDVAWVEWQQHSIKALETTLQWLVHFLAPASALVIWIGEPTDRRALGLILERLGFRVEVGTRCEHGLAMAARRLDANQQAMAA